MSVWSTVDGNYLINKNIKFSLRKYVVELSDKLCVSCNQAVSGENIKVTFKIQVNLDGMAAANFVDKLNKKLGEISILQQVEASIRYS